MALVLVAGLFLLPLAAVAAPLSVPNYCALTVERLKLAERTWTRANRPPNAEEEAPVYQNYGTTVGEYLALGSLQAREISLYLSAHPDLSAEIDRLSASIREHIQKRTTP